MKESSLEVPGSPASIQPTRRIGCGFWLSWLLATVLGSGIGWIAGWWVSFRIPGILATISLGLVSGLVLGLLQWLVLRGILPGAGWWIIATGLAWGIGFPGGAFLASSLRLTDLAFSLVLGSLIGLCSGTAQMLLLRRVSSYAGWWVPASLFSWASAFIYYQGGLTLRGAFFGLLVGILSGWALVGIMNFSGTRKTPSKDVLIS